MKPKISFKVVSLFFEDSLDRADMVRWEILL